MKKLCEKLYETLCEKQCEKTASKKLWFYVRISLHCFPYKNKRIFHRRKQLLLEDLEVGDVSPMRAQPGDR